MPMYKSSFYSPKAKNRQNLSSFRRGGRITSLSVGHPERGVKTTFQPTLAHASEVFHFHNHLQASLSGCGNKKPIDLHRWVERLSGWQDSNLRPPAPKAGAIPGYATPREIFCTSSRTYFWQLLAASCQIAFNQFGTSKVPFWERKYNKLFTRFK
jgi:hypothetical protein